MSTQTETSKAAENLDQAWKKTRDAFHEAYKNPVCPACKIKMETAWDEMQAAIDAAKAKMS